MPSLTTLSATFAPEQGVFLPELYNADLLGLDGEQTAGLVALCGAYAAEVRPLLGVLADGHADVQAMIWPGTFLSDQDLDDIGGAIDARLRTVARIERSYARTIREGYKLLTDEQVTQATAIRRDQTATDAARLAHAMGVNPVMAEAT